MPDSRDIERGVPPSISAKERRYFWYYVAWSIIYYTVGLGAAVLAAITAVNSGRKITQNTAPTRLDVITAAASAGLAFLGSGLDANKRADHFNVASAILDSAMERYRHDPNMTMEELTDDSVMATLQTRGITPNKKALKEIAFKFFTGQVLRTEGGN